jgi:succinate dehydrogenase / fumarate reductase membrane anchor subunit
MSDPARAAHEGAQHWRVQRLTALALLVLGVWLVISLAVLPDLGYATLRVWSARVINAALLALLVTCACWHSKLGVEVVIDDYVRGPLNRGAQIASTLAHLLLGAAGMLAVARLALFPVP